MLSVSLLVARSAAERARARPLAVVGAPRLSERLIAALDRFVETYAPGSAWGAVDERGIVALHGDGFDGTRHLQERPPGRTERAVFDPFTDLGQWMLKVLLSHRLPADMQLHDGEGRLIDRPIRNARSLGALGGVSLPAAARLVAHLRNAGHRADASPLELIREADLLERWRTAYLARPVKEIRARWLFPRGDGTRILERALERNAARYRKTPGNRACLGFFAACRHWDLGFAAGVPPHLYLERPSASALEELGLAVAHPAEQADVIIRVPRFAESVFRGAAAVDTKVPVTDVIQCWLDVSGHARGSETAQHIYDRVIGPRIAGIG